jgi:hypothetical protein
MRGYRDIHPWFLSMPLWRLAGGAEGDEWARHRLQEWARRWQEHVKWENFGSAWATIPRNLRRALRRRVKLMQAGIPRLLEACEQGDAWLAAERARVLGEISGELNDFVVRHILDSAMPDIRRGEKEEQNINDRRENLLREYYGRAFVPDAVLAGVVLRLRREQPPSEKPLSWTAACSTAARQFNIKDGRTVRRRKGVQAVKW